MLEISKQTFQKFTENEIRYCHWKSNEHLLEGLDGITDLDVLIDRSSYNRVVEILMELGYKTGDTLFYLDYSSIADYIGFDSETGKMVHLHLHFELMIGKKFVKGIHLPWEKVIYQSLMVDRETGINIIDSNIEMILLFIRNYAKKNVIHKIKRKGLSKDDKVEFDWLKPRVTREKLNLFSEYFHLENLGELIFLYTENPHRKNLNKIYKVIDKILKSQYFFNNIKQNFRYFRYKLTAAKNLISFRYFNRPVRYRRGISQGGLIIAFAGVDGAGKSTLIKEVNKWLSWKIDTYNIYFGSGDGSSSLIRKPLRVIAKLRIKKRGNSLNITEADAEKKKKKLKWAKAIWAVTLASEKKKKFQDMLKARSQGMVILTDRYPQDQIKGFNDGPLLSDWESSKNPIKRKLYRYEREIYNLSNIFQPDIFFKLTISEELSAKRKNDTPLYMIRKKINAIETIKFTQSKEITIDSSGTVEQSSLQIKRAIWNS